MQGHIITFGEILKLLQKINGELSVFKSEKELMLTIFP